MSLTTALATATAAVVGARQHRDRRAAEAGPARHRLATGAAPHAGDVLALARATAAQHHLDQVVQHLLTVTATTPDRRVGAGDHAPRADPATTPSTPTERTHR